MKTIIVLMLLGVLNVAYGDIVNGLIAYYPFNGNANDASGNGKNAVVHGATLTIDRFGNANSAYSFNGIDNYIVAVVSNLPAGSSPRTMTAWFKRTKSVIQDQMLGVVGFGAGNGLNTQFGMGFSPSDRVICWAGYTEFESPCAVTINNWCFIAFSYSNTYVSIMVNGTNYDHQYTVPLNTATNRNFFIGVTSVDGRTPSWPAGFWDKWFTGCIDDVRLYDRALSVEEVEQLYEMEKENPLLSIETAAVRISWKGALNIHYRVQTSSDLINWSNLTSVVGTGVETNLIDWTDGTHKFYRLILLP